jgi:hypothetical protein
MGCMPAQDLTALRAFRTALHACCDRRANALCERVDSLLTAEAVASLPHLITQAVAPASRNRSCAGVSSWLRSATCRLGPTHRRCSGCGGPERECRIWTCGGAPTSAASTWSTRCASASSALAGQRPGCATQSRPLAQGMLTPCRVRRALSALRPLVGTPARAPKPCGRPPGRPKGSRSGRAPRYPALKKAA